MSTSHSSIAQRRGSLLQRLSLRERYMVAAGTIFVLLFLFYQIVVGPFFTSKQQLERSLKNKARDVVELKLLQKQYQQVSGNKKAIAERLQTRDPGFSLFTFVEQQVDLVRMKERVTLIKPAQSEYENGLRQSIIELKIEGIVLAQLVDFLALIESFDKVVFVERIAVQTNGREAGLLDATLSVLTFEIEPAS